MQMEAKVSLLQQIQEQMRRKLDDTQKLINMERTDGQGKMELLMEKVKEENERKAALEMEKKL